MNKYLFSDSGKYGNSSLYNNLRLTGQSVGIIRKANNQNIGKR
jgi:hypothetical protein